MTTGDTSPRAGEYWKTTAAALWREFGPPLRPSAADTEMVRQVLDTWAGRFGAPRVLLLGLTPEVHRLAVARGWDLLAVDRSGAMIEAIWTGAPETVRCADWTDLPLPAGSRDVAVLDGGLQMQAYPDGQRQVAAQLRRVLAPGGLFVCRLFVPPIETETPADVLADLEAGRVPSLNALKLRLCIALQPDPTTGVALREVWEVLTRAHPDLDALAGRLGWTRAHMRAIHAYREAPNRYWYAGTEQVRALLCDRVGGFTLDELHIPDYPLGERCPTLVFRRLAD